MVPSPEDVDDSRSPESAFGASDPLKHHVQVRLRIQPVDLGRAQQAVDGTDQSKAMRVYEGSNHSSLVTAGMVNPTVHRQKPKVACNQFAKRRCR